jgi:hypothetical protein
MMMITFTTVLLPLGVLGGGMGRPGVGLAIGAPVATGAPTTAAPHFSQNLVPSVSGHPQLAQNPAISSSQVQHKFSRLLKCPAKRLWTSRVNLEIAGILRSFRQRVKRRAFQFIRFARTFLKRSQRKFSGGIPSFNLLRLVIERGENCSSPTTPFSRHPLPSGAKLAARTSEKT